MRDGVQVHRALIGDDLLVLMVILLIVVLEGVAKLGDYVKWLRVYPYNDR